MLLVFITGKRQVTRQQRDRHTNRNFWKQYHPRWAEQVVNTR